MGWLLIIAGVVTSLVAFKRMDSAGADDWLCNIGFCGGLLLCLIGCGMMGGTFDMYWLLTAHD